MNKLYQIAKTLMILCVTVMFISLTILILTLNKEVKMESLGLQQLLKDTDNTVRLSRKAVQETRNLIVHSDELVFKQKKYTDAQNQELLQVMQSADATLVKLRTTLEEVDKNEGVITATTVEAINDLQPLLKASTISIQKAGDTIGDPNIKIAAEQAAEAMKNVNLATANVAQTTKRVDDKVAEMLKPKSLLKTIGSKLLGAVANLKTIFLK